MKPLFTLVLFLTLYGCTSGINSSSTKLAAINVSINQQISPMTDSSIYEVAKEDYHNNVLQRLFVVISVDKINNSEILQQIICDLEKNYPLESKSNISLFSHKKYADYKSNLFFNKIDEPGFEPDINSYKKWKNQHYLGEFDCKTRILKSYPSCEDNCDGKEFKLIKCP